MSVNINDLPDLPDMMILEETPEMIYQRWMNRAIALAKERSLPPPDTEQGGFFYDLWYPIAQELAEQQELMTYSLIQAFPIWADDEYLDAHGWSAGIPRKTGEDDDTYRLRQLDQAFEEEGSGRVKDYESWARKFQGVGTASGVEKARHDNSIDLYLADLSGSPVTEEFAASIKTQMWDNYRIAGHDLEVYPAPVFILKLEAKIENAAGDLETLAETIRTRIKNYAAGRTTLAYHYLSALVILDVGEDYAEVKVNGGNEDVQVPRTAILQVEVVLS
ncbi:baseplate J/gp47 family protein [Paenibacillus kandeliae]|uniref:baseplate J/gp47 family protein n=1 Tax=Paenibacillus kandeliae TaxID=3231269 RepID=UPI00345A0B3E